MIHVQIMQTSDGNISSFKMKGHADFAEKGQDIVCAGASAVSFGSINAIMELTGVKPDIQQSNGGYLECTIPDALPNDIAEKVQLLLHGMVISLQTIERDYGKYIKITFR
ncbi:ribosomal-processing cysteine protease Prp [Bacillus sp. FJAT-49736]|uniref:ribosomal-processing cysteine protease Prp n=1 Tax=Bacillus sp. FJAT-49736 TaxID=2833582 RepID=UPI001BC928D7|nr:ribosomal-processing cysteine protease Prp [Bacillus sp. FJAT-49736]MBS4173691.1 ribosomal-processing cysteine protease Prp [Bacillus sp. FJAT-49736]